jgi:hypothetical protein
VKTFFEELEEIAAERARVERAWKRREMEEMEYTRMIKAMKRVATLPEDEEKTYRLEAKQVLKCIAKADRVWNGVSTCWLHTGARDMNGYARTTVQRTKGRIVSRLVLCLSPREPRPYPISENPDEAGHLTPFICRKGNRHCIRPSHLQWETRAEGLARRQLDERLLPREKEIMAGIKALADELTQNYLKERVFP